MIFFSGSSNIHSVLLSPVFIQGCHKSEIDGKGVDINRKRTINYGLQKKEKTRRKKQVSKRRTGKRKTHYTKRETLA